MRWKKRERKRVYKQGEIRTKKKFLFIPKCLSTDGYIDRPEWRWLERAPIQQKCKRVYYVLWKHWYDWDNVKWDW